MILQYDGYEFDREYGDDGIKVNDATIECESLIDKSIIYSKTRTMLQELGIGETKSKAQEHVKL